MKTLRQGFEWVSNFVLGSVFCNYMFSIPILGSEQSTLIVG
jgi:hypothetical protein